MARIGSIAELEALYGSQPSVQPTRRISSIAELESMYGQPSRQPEPSFDFVGPVRPGEEYSPQFMGPIAPPSPRDALQRQVDATIAARETSQRYATLPKRVADVYNVYKNEDLAREALDLADQLKIEYPEYGEDIEDLLMKGLRPEDIRTQITQKRERKRRQSELATQYPDFAKDVDKLFGEGFSPEEVTSRMEAMAGAKARIEQRNQEALDRKSAETYAKEIEAQQARTREILSTAGIEAGPSASRVGELTRQIEVGRAAGQDISDLERERRLIQAYGIQGLPIVARISALRRRLATAPESERADIQFLINSLQRGLGGATTEQVATAQPTPGEALTQQLYGEARGAVTGATLGAARPLFERAEEATGGVVPRQGIGETAAEAIGGLATGVVGAGALAPSVSGLYAGLGGVGAQAATRGTIGGIQSGAQTAIALAQGADISPADAAVNIGQGILSSALSVPIAARVPGVKLNAAAQVAGDFVVDLAADVAYRDRLKDQSFVDWLLKEELPNIAVSIAGAGKDVLDARAAKTEIRRLFDQRMRSGEATPPPPTRAEPSEPELVTRPSVEAETPTPARDFVLDPETGRPVETDGVGTTDDLFKIKLKSLGYSDDEAARALSEFRNRGDTDSDIEENIKDIEYAQQQAAAASEARRKEATETARRAREDVEFRRRQIEERAVEPTPRPEPAPGPEPLPPTRQAGPITEFTSADDLRTKLQEKIAGATNKRQAIEEDARYYGVSTNGKTAQQVVDEIVAAATKAVEPEPVVRPPVAEEPPARQASEETIPGTRAIAQRIENARNKFVEFAMESAGLTREQAVKALESYKKSKAIKIDPIVGQFSFTHGGFAEADVLRRAAGLEDVVAPVARAEQPSAPAPRPAEPAPEPGKKARGFSSYKQTGFTPVIDSIDDAGGLLPRSQLRHPKGGEYDSAPKVSELGGFGRVVYGGQIPAEEMATILWREGKISSPSPDVMFEEIRKEIRQYRENREAISKAEKEDKLVVKQDKAFNRDAISKPKTAEPVNTSSLNVGDEVKIGGESFKVLEIDPDTNAVVLEDGEKYGVQIVEDGVTIYGKVEKKAPQAEGESPFGEELRLESQTPEQIAAERARSEQRAEIERRQAEPMRGKPLDTTADIFGEGETPLFNQRRAEAAAPQPQRLEDLDLGNLRAEIDAIASYQGKQKRLNELAEQFGVPTGGTPREILVRIEEAYNAAKERQVAEGGVGEYRGDGARVQEEGQDRIVTPEVQEGRPEAGGGYRPAPGGNVPPGPVGRGVQGEEVAPAAGPERRATFYIGKSGRVDVTFPDEKSKNAYSAWKLKQFGAKPDIFGIKKSFYDLNIAESVESKRLFQEYVEYVKEQASEAARNKSGSVDVMSVEDWFRSKGVVPVAEPGAGPKYMKDRAQAVERAKQLGLDTEGTTSEIAARVSKKEKVISFFDEMEKSARVRLEELRKGGTLGANKPVGIAAEYLIIGTAKFGKGVTEFGAWSAEMVKEFGSQVKPYLRQLFNSSKSAARREYGSQDEAIEYINTLSSDLKIEKAEKGVEPSAREILPEGEEISRVVEKPAREVGLRNELGDAERREFKFADLPEVESKSVDVEWNKSAKKIQEDPGYGERLTDELGKNPGRPMSEEDSAVMLRYKRMLASEIDAASEAMSKARSPEEMADATARFERATYKYESVVNAAKNAGTVWGRTGVWRQMVAAEDYSLARMVTKARAANNGAELAPERRDEIVRQSEKIKSLQNKVDEIEKAGGAAGVGGAIKAEVDAIKTGKVTPPEAEPVVNPNKIASSIKELARYFVSRGVTDRTKLIEEIHRVVSKVDPEITIRDVRDSFTDYGKFSPISKEELEVKLRDLRQQLQQVSKLEDMEAGRAPRKTGQERQPPSDEGRRLIKMVNEAKKKGGYDVTDPARQLASAMQAVKTRLTNQIADLEYQIREKRKIIKEKKGIEYDAEALALQKRRDELKAEYDNVFGKPELTDEQRVARAMSAVNRSIEDLTRRIKSGDLFPEKTKKVPPESPELVARMAERDALREQLKELQLIARPKKTPEEISLQSYKTRVRNQIAEIQRKIAAGDFSTKPKKKMEMDEEASRLYYELDKAKQDFNKSLIEDRWRNYSAGKKVWETTKDISSNLTRALITSIDLPVARQGLFTLVTRPVTSISAIPSTLKAMVSKEQHFRVMDEIRRRPSYKAMKAAGLEITEPESANIMKQEESFRGRLIEKMPRWIGGGLVRGSQRAYEAFLNKVRADVFDSMSKTLAKGGAPTDKELKLIANMINVATGRGSLSPQNAQKLAGASSVFFAPRYAVSRFQLALGQPLLTSLGDVGWKDTSRARKIIASEYAKFLGGAAAFYSLIEMRNQLVDEDEQWSVEKDPRSSDFGKVKVGNTRIDPLGGLSQVTVFLSKLATGESKSAQGDVRVLREAGRPLNLFRRDSDPMKTAELEFGKSDIRGLVKDFLERKLAPTVTIPMNIAAQQRMFERKGESAGYGPLELAQDLVVPLSVRDIYEAMLDQGVPAATAYAMLAFFGLSTQTYKVEEKKEREEKSELPGLKNMSGGLKTIK